MKKEKYLGETGDALKLPGVLALLKSWDANILCLAETQVSWRCRKVREVVRKELGKIDKYAGIVGASSETISMDIIKPGGCMMA